MEDFGSSLAHALHRYGVWLIVLVVAILAAIGVSVYTSVEREEAIATHWQNLQKASIADIDALREAVKEIDDPTTAAWKHGMIRLGWALLRDERYQHARGAFEKVIEATEEGELFHDYARFGKAAVAQATGDEKGEADAILAELTDRGEAFLSAWAMYETMRQRNMVQRSRQLDLLMGETVEVELAPTPIPEDDDGDHADDDGEPDDTTETDVNNTDAPGDGANTE